MLRSFKGIWRWHRKAEGGRPSSVLLSLHSSVVISNNSFTQTIGPVEYGRFLFCAQAFAQRLAVNGSFLARIGSLIEM